MSEYFDNKAQDWDQKQDRSDRARQIAGLIAARVPLSGKDAGLDFGCGTGLLGFELAAQFKRFVFADTSKGMLAEVERKAGEAGLVNVGTLNLAEQQLSGAFDLIVSLMALHHIEDHGRAIAGLCAHLTEGGHICLADLDSEDGSFHADEIVPHNGFARSEIEDLLQRNGVSVTHSQTGFVMRKRIEGREREYPVFLIIGSLKVRA